MSYKLKVKITTQQGDRYVELDRSNLSYNALRSETERRTKQQGQWFLKAGARQINNDQDLAAAVVEAENGGAHYLEVQLQGGVAPRPAQQQAQPSYSAPPAQQHYHAPQPTYSAPPAQQHQAPAQPTYQQPTHQQPAHSAPAQTSGPSGRFTTFDVFGSPSAAGDKPSVAPEQTDDGYAFTRVICKNGYSVEVTVEPVNAEQSCIKFRLSREGGSSTQSFKLGFAFGLEALRHDAGNVIRVVYA